MASLWVNQARREAGFLLDILFLLYNGERRNVYGGREEVGIRMEIGDFLSLYLHYTHIY